MSQQKQDQRHHFHHHKEEENQNLTPYEKAMNEEKKHRRMEHLGELGVVAAGTFGLVVFTFSWLIKRSPSAPSLRCDYKTTAQMPLSLDL